MCERARWYWECAEWVAREADMLRRRRQALELALGTAFMVGPMVYALTLQTPSEPVGVCEPSVVVVAPRVCEPATPAPVVEPATPAPVVEPVEPVVEPEPPISPAMALGIEGRRVVLTTEAKAGWGTGKFYEPTGTASYRVAKEAAVDKLPKLYRQWADATYDLYGQDGKVCSVTLGEPYVIAQYDGWGLEGVLGEAVFTEDGDETPGDEIPASRWRRPLWRSQPKWLVADIIPQGDCHGPLLWARDASLPAPVVLSRTTDSNPVAAARIAQLEGSAEYAELRDEYESWYAELPEEAKEYEDSWSTMVEHNPAKVTSWMLGDTPRVIALEFGMDSESCGSGFDAFIGAVELVEPGRLVPTEQWTGIRAIFDADLDGRWEYLYSAGWDNTSVLESETEALRFGLGIEEDFVCPC